MWEREGNWKGKVGGKEPLRSRLQELDENIDIKKHLKKRKGRAVSEPLWRRENVGPSPSSSRPETRVTNIGFSTLFQSPYLAIFPSHLKNADKSTL